jgi:acyl phosphate:glycerol-3-phosphate acyltransferase
MIFFAAILVAYLLGSIPFGYILVRAFRGEDVRLSGSGNIGATNVARKAPLLGAATLLLDAVKGFVAVSIGFEIGIHAWNTGRHSVAPITLAAICGVFVILGHLFPVWLKFRGGKGVATSVGVFLALAPKALLIALLIFAAVVAIFRYVSLGSIVAVALFPLIAYLARDYHDSAPLLAAMCVIAVLVIAKHEGNIRRLLSGTEHRFEFKRSRV